jgi:hypothetical protein
VKTVTKQVGERQMRFKTRKLLAHRRDDNSLVLAGGTRGEWTPHDLRRTAATMIQWLRITPDVIDRCQNHALLGSKVRRHYLHYDYADEKRPGVYWANDWMSSYLAGTWCRCSAQGRATRSSKHQPVQWDNSAA